MEKKESKIKSSLGLSNMNGISTDDERSCALNDMNCLDGQAEQNFAYDNMNAVGSDDETTCSLDDMNCQGDDK